MPVVRSKLARDVLRLYADYIRLSRHVHGLKDIARLEFRQYKHLQPKDNLLYIEYLLRRARNQLTTLQGHGVKSISLSPGKKNTPEHE